VSGGSKDGDPTGKGEDQSQQGKRPTNTGNAVSGEEGMVGTSKRFLEQNDISLRGGVSWKGRLTGRMGKGKQKRGGGNAVRRLEI